MGEMVKVRYTPREAGWGVTRAPKIEMSSLNGNPIGAIRGAIATRMRKKYDVPLRQWVQRVLSLGYVAM